MQFEQAPERADSFGTPHDALDSNSPSDSFFPTPSANDFGSSHEPGDGPDSTANSLASAPNDVGDRPRRRRRGTRGGRRRRAHTDSAPEIATDDEPSETPSERPDDSGEAPSAHVDDGGADASATVPGSRSRRGRRRRGRRGAVRSDGPESAPSSDVAELDSAMPAHERDVRVDRVPLRAETSARVRQRSDETASQDGGPGGKKSRRRRRGSRGGRSRAVPPELPVEVEAIPGEEDDLPELLDLPVETERVGDAPRGARHERDAAPRERGRKKSRRRGRGRDTEELDEPHEVAAPVPERKSLILVNASDQEEQRVAVVESEMITDFQMTVRSQNSVINDIYRGRVVNLEPAIGAAFVDFGQGRNGFLHTSDVLSVYGDKDWNVEKLLTTTVDAGEWESDANEPSASDDLEVDSDDEGGEEPEVKRPRRAKGEHTRRFRARPRLPITDLLRKGETVVVQVTKDAIGDKGPTLTTYISIPGRYLVLMPCMSRTGVSRKIEDEKERRRLKKILQQLDVPPGMGVIVRTAGIGHTKADLKRDLDYLRGVWENFSQRMKAGHGPAPLYRESDVAIRTVRDLFTPETEAVIVDDPEVHRQIVDFTRQLMPENVERVKLYSGGRPLFHHYGIEAEFEKVFARRIELPSGGSIVFDQAEALVAIDVNSGRTRTDGFDFEEIALKANLDAAPEIARQIRLRDLGGIIVVDFIDMMKMSNIRTVERVFKDALATDRARSKLGRISQFGLLELTRQRLGPGMHKKVFHTCPRCRGTGRVRTIESRAAAILRRLGSALTLKGFSTVEVRAHPEVIAYLKDSCNEVVRALEYRFEREIRLIDAPDQSEDSVLRYLRTDGREVRPGGRRKR